MKVTPIRFYPKREITQARLDRLSTHRATVLEQNGILVPSVTTVVSPTGDFREITTRSISPSQTERTASVEAVRELFADLQHMNVIVTNACNLSCSYCYEQHTDDYGKFTTDTLKQLYDFLVAINPKSGKLFQFFGGEPLIHRKLIIEFIDQYREMVERNSDTTAISIITNGILLSPQFIETYFSVSNACMSISLDTDDASVDHREIGQDRIDHILRMMALIPKQHKDNHMISVRCTISVENVHRLESFMRRVYETGVRAAVIHPLTMSSVNGHIVWSVDEWDILRTSIRSIVASLPEFEVQFSEGVGTRGGNNCMVGSDMIAVDASGDYSGCHFFTNQKVAAPHTILGNLLRNEVYVDRYASFAQQYAELFEHPQCKACDLKGFCYQCPAGNSDSGTGQLFRPDDMCQNIVRLFLDLQQDLSSKTFKAKYQEIIGSLSAQTEDQLTRKAIAHLHHYVVHGVHISSPVMDDRPTQEMIGSLVTMVTDTSYHSLTLKDAYETIQRHRGHDHTASTKVTDTSHPHTRMFYLTLLHMILLNSKGDKMNPTKIVKL